MFKSPRVRFYAQRPIPGKVHRLNGGSGSTAFTADGKNTEHINSLEMRAILLSLRWRVCHLEETEVRFAHLTDSYVCMSVISKGRSSSDMLMHIMRKVSAFCFAFGLLPILLHVESTENPTDEASRL